MIISKNLSTHKQQGFTIVELLIVVVVIAILAAITIVAYNGVRDRAISSSLQSDLSSAKSQLEVARVTEGLYPSDANSLKSSASTTYEYTVDNSSSTKTFCLTATAGTISYFINNDSTPQAGACPGHANGGSFTYQLAWTNQTSSGSRNWWGIASSADGTKVAGAVYNGPIVTSTNSGATFQTSGSGTSGWYDVASSDDGNTLYAASASASGLIRKSSNGGSTWTTTGAGTRDWRMVETSSDGSVVVALPFSGSPWVSTDGGTTFTERTGTGTQNWYSVAVSGDGAHIYAGAQYRYYYSNNQGQSWTARETGANKMAVSTDGATVFSTDGYTFKLSKNYGATFTAVTALPAASSTRFVSVSGDGKKLAALLEIGGNRIVWASGNAGQDWTEQTNFGTWSILSGQYSRNGQNLYVGPNAQPLQIGR